MDGLDGVYHSQFGAGQRERHDRQFENGIRDDELVIRTSGAQRSTARMPTRTPFPSFAAPSVPIASFSFIFPGPGTKAVPKRRRKKPAATTTRTSRQPREEHDVTLSSSSRERDDDDDDGDADFREMGSHEALRRSVGKFTRSRARRAAGNDEAEVQSREVVEDGGVPAAPPPQFVSLREASRVMSAKSFESMINEFEENYVSSCDELERRLEEEDQRARSVGTVNRPRRSVPGNVAPESLDSVSVSGAGSVDRRKRSRCHDEDDDEDDDMFYDHDASINSRRAPRRKPDGGESGGGSGGAGGGDKPRRGSGRNAMSSLNCFLCRYGNKKYDSVNRQHVLDLYETIEQGIGHKDPVTLSRVVHLQFMRTIWTESRLGGNKGVPIWHTIDVLDHLLNHDQDPRIWIWLAIVDTKRAIECCSQQAFMRDPASGLIVPNLRASETRMKLEAHLIKLYSLDSEHMNFFQPSAQIDLGRANRRVEGVTLQKKRKHYAHRDEHLNNAV